MSLKNKSVETIEGPRFIDLRPVDVNPLMDSCTVKVFYLGKNRNYSSIDEDTAVEMAKTLRGAPIVAAWREAREDFGDHGDVIVVEDGEMRFSCKTVPYGFVSPDADVWFQDFDEPDEETGSTVTRTYMMTTGYLWTGQYPELEKLVRTGGQPQSMELDGDSCNGHWEYDEERDVEFFIINDATFSKLCILGDDVEPCFEGASVTPGVPRFSVSGSDFARTLYSMMGDLKAALATEGGLKVNTEFEADEAVEGSEPAVAEEEAVVAEEETVSAEGAAAATDAPSAVSEEGDDEDVAETEAEGEPEADDNGDGAPMVRLAHTDEEFDALQAAYDALEAEVASLREFKLAAEDKEKDAVIAKYYMLDDEDKADVVAHKREYSVHDIEAALALAYVNKNVDFNQFDDEEAGDAEQRPATTFSLDEPVSPAVSDFVKALRSTDKHLF
jgi:hypothetical protein